MPRLPATALLLGAGLAVAAAGPTATAASAQDVVPGRVAERIASPTDPSQSYALYVPSGYDPARRWPVLLVLDPRGRALEAMEPFVAPAERHGWIVFSSYNTLSDGPVEPNVRAMNAMLADARGTFAVHPRRFYLAGFSGTARMAWDFAAQMEGAVAGIFGAGATTVIPRVALPGVEPPRLSWFGAVGERDFNYDEVRGFRPWLERYGLPHRIRVFDGPHRWPPAPVAAHAVRWFELRAMAEGLRPVDPGLVDDLRSADVAEARRLEAEGRLADAQRRWREVASDYRELAPVEGAEGRAEELADDPRVRAVRSRRDERGREFDRFRDRLGAWLVRMRDEDPVPSVEEGVRALGIDEVRRAAGEDAAAEEAGDPGEGDREDAALAARKAAHASAWLAFYEPRAFLEAGEPERALLSLALADRLEPGGPGVELYRARALLALDRRAEALGAVERAVEAGLPPERLAGDESLAALRDESRFQALVAGRPRESG